MVAKALGETFLNNKVGYRSVISQNEITWFFKILDIFRTAVYSVQINSGYFFFTKPVLLLRIDQLPEMYEVF